MQSSTGSGQETSGTSLGVVICASNKTQGCRHAALQKELFFEKGNFETCKIHRRNLVLKYEFWESLLTGSQPNVKFCPCNRFSTVLMHSPDAVVVKCDFDNEKACSLSSKSYFFEKIGNSFWYAIPFCQHLGLFPANAPLWFYQIAKRCSEVLKDLDRFSRWPTLKMIVVIK